MYRLISENDSEGVAKGTKFIPNSTTNRDWREYLRWKEEGNTPDPWKTQEELAEEEAEKSRIDAIAVARESTDISKYTVDQIDSFVDSRLDLTGFDAAGDFASVKAELRILLVNLNSMLKRIGYEIPR